MKHYPLLFAFRDKVAGNGFLADVAAHGRALAAQEEEGWWISGVEPGDIAAGGTNFAEATVEFRNAFTAVLFDIADDARDQQTFKAGVETFFAAMDTVAAQEWQTALADVRSGRITADALSEGLPTKPADSPRGVEITIFEALELVRPTANVLESQMAIAA